ncbi:hypothetical protein DK419_15905 [Methylobacterium terrae]|uniref:Transposase n=1 Tax=Methylobacterium terrae TaxID=2202827 RepID=A0A2U8WN99_9HYPH|nr:hypothetical protein DK419_15905 [Methylobacterium terrae]
MGRGLLWRPVGQPRTSRSPPLLAPPRPRQKGGRRPIEYRAALTGILLVLRSGLPWESARDRAAHHPAPQREAREARPPSSGRGTGARLVQPLPPPADPLRTAR